MKRLAVVALLVALVALLAPAGALACTCMWAGPFTKVALGTDLVVLAEVRAHDGSRMDVRVIEALRGSDRRPALRIWGGDDASCRAPVKAFPPETRWIFAVKRFGELRPRDYAVSVCGEHWLEVRGDRAVGRITVAEYGFLTEAAPLADVLAWVRSGGVTPLAPITRR